MNAAEHIVESYFRLCKNCFTRVDVKVESGAGRQLDILAYNIENSKEYHIEVAVTHRLNWCPSEDDFKEYFEKKFFGVPPVRANARNGLTDHERNKNYFDAIKKTYKENGFLDNKDSPVKRVYVCWAIKGETQPNEPRNVQHVIEGENFSIEVLSMRDVVIPELIKKIGTANYDDEVLRTLAFLKQCDEQNTSR